MNAKKRNFFSKSIPVSTGNKLQKISELSMLFLSQFFRQDPDLNTGIKKKECKK
jgi:hypothetical protein